MGTRAGSCQRLLGGWAGRGGLLLPRKWRLGVAVCLGKVALPRPLLLRGQLVCSFCFGRDGRLGCLPSFNLEMKKIENNFSELRALSWYLVLKEWPGCRRGCRRMLGRPGSPWLGRAALFPAGNRSKPNACFRRKCKTKQNQKRSMKSVSRPTSHRIINKWAFRQAGPSRSAGISMPHPASARGLTRAASHFPRTANPSPQSPCRHLRNSAERPGRAGVSGIGPEAGEVACASAESLAPASHPPPPAPQLLRAVPARPQPSRSYPALPSAGKGEGWG